VRQLDAWCGRWLGAGVDEILFEKGHLSRVFGIRLTDRREVVVKVRPAAARLAACADVQRALWQAGFPCPQPLVGPVPLDGHAVNAEVLVPGGELLGVADSAAESAVDGPVDSAVDAPAGRYAELLARLVRLAPDQGGRLAPNPPWVAWDHGNAGVWPPPDDRADDLNAHPETGWLDEIGRRVRRRLHRIRGVPSVVGHGDWEAQNLRWHGGTPWVVHDWDSVISAPEPVVVGLAASVWPCGARPRAATVDESRAFIEAYQRAADRRWSTDETEASWAAGLWVYAFNAKKASLDGVAWLDPDEAQQRLALAGA
jgi:Ser/Thr protein kinase RdoA (MazF antagonist)